MAKIENLNDIEEIIVHWSESTHINDALGCDEDGDIEKKVDVFAFDKMVEMASKSVGSGYDKTSLTVKMKSGLLWASESKFYLTRNEDSLLGLLNKSE